jgi:hypothetical protein
LPLGAIAPGLRSTVLKAFVIYQVPVKLSCCAQT